MGPLDSIDRVTAGHFTYPSPEREPAIQSFDGPNDARPPPLHPDAHRAAFRRALLDDNATPANDSYPSPPLTSPPAYRPTPLPQPAISSSPPPPRRISFFLNRAHLRCHGFLHWLRLVYPDILFMLLVLAVTRVIMKFGHVVFRWDQRYFPMTWDPISERWYGPAELSYPLSPFILGILFTALLIPAMGVAVILCMQVWVRSFWDVNAGLFGLFKGLVMMTFIQIFVKQWIGEFRPYFITVCNPVLSPPIMTDPFPFRRFVTPKSCRSPKEVLLLAAMQSFPSGHTSESFFLGTFLALYLNAKLKAFSDYHTGFWKWLAVMFPLFGSCLMAGTLVVDNNHHIHDILLSIPWGVLVAFLAYRCHYASIFNYRTNHLPLPWSGSHQSLRPTIPVPETRHGDNITAVTWPRKPIEHSFDGEREQATEFGVDGTTDRLRRPRGISRGRLRHKIFGGPTPLMQSGSGTMAPAGQEQHELRDFADSHDVQPAVGAAGPSSARASGHQIDLEGQRHRRWTSESGEEMG